MIPALLALLACGEPPPPLQSEQSLALLDRPEATAPAPAAEVWTVDRLADLHPRRPAREGRTPAPLALDPALQAVIARLGAVVDRNAGDPRNAWAIAHGLLARGESFQLTNGQRAIEALFATWGETWTAGGLTLLRFPAERDGVRIEPHTGLLLKNLAEAGADPTRAVTVAGRTWTLADLYRGVLASTWLDIESSQASFRSPDDVAWLLQGLSAWAPPQGLAWRNAEGRGADLALLTRFTTGVLVKETAFLAEAMAKNQGFERKGQGIFRYTCGGAHVLQGAAYAVARGHGSARERAAIEAQVPLHFWRFDHELALLDATLERAPEHRLRLGVQRLKFTGHMLESLHKLAALALYVPDAAQSDALARIAREVQASVAALEAQGVYDHLPDLRRQDEQLYLDVVGDSAHALRGLLLATGQAGILW